MIQGFEKYRRLIEALPEKALYEKRDLITDHFFLFSDGKLSAYYVPFHYMKPEARVALIGLTPGWTQMERAFRCARESLANGLDGDALF